MWLVRRAGEGKYSVGYYQPDGEFYEHADYLRRDKAEEMCAYLNGGGHSNYQPNL
jgi:hypothetical protein